MLIEEPICPEQIADKAIAEQIPGFMQIFNKAIRENIRYQGSGPFVCLDVSDYISMKVNDPLTTKVLTRIKKMYESVGWEIRDDLQEKKDGGYLKPVRYLTFISNVWKD